MVITDLDNTLFDWFEIWHKSFSALLNSLVEKSRVPRSVLIPEIQEIHQLYGTSEYSFLIEELPSLRAKNPGGNLLEVYAEAVQAFRIARETSLKLYPGVKDTLEFIRATGCRVVGYTDSQKFYSSYRIIRLGLDGLLDYVYTPPDHPLPRGLTAEVVRTSPPNSYQFQHTLHRFTPEGETKPNSSLLLDIMRQTGGRRQETIYVGDNLMKDVAMAKAAKIIDVQAKYGEVQNRPEYELLQLVSHWPAQTVQLEKELTRADVKPTYELRQSFAELRDLFDYQRLETETS